MQTVLSNSGFIIKTDEGESSAPNVENRAVSFNAGFITSATNSMVNDHPSVAAIEHDVLRFQVQQGNSSLPLINYIVNELLKANNKKIGEYFKVNGKRVSGWKMEIKQFKLMAAHKTGVMIEEGEVRMVKLLNLKDSHPVQFSRDFIGYYFELSIKGRLIFKSGSQVAERTELQISRIPLLAFKSNNSITNAKARKMSEEILFKLVGKTLQVIYI